MKKECKGTGSQLLQPKVLWHETINSFLNRCLLFMKIIYSVWFPWKSLGVLDTLHDFHKNLSDLQLSHSLWTASTFIWILNHVLDWAFFHFALDWDFLHCALNWASGVVSFFRGWGGVGLLGGVWVLICLFSVSANGGSDAQAPGTNRFQMRKDEDDAN